jgi:hypothetical protein
MNRENYLLAKANGLEARFRGDEISKEIAKDVPMSEQIAILMDRDTKPEKFAKYQQLRAEAKERVDAKILAIQAEEGTGI